MSLGWEQCCILAPVQHSSKCWVECFFPPLMPSSGVKHHVTPGHFILSFMAVLWNLPPSPSYCPRFIFQHMLRQRHPIFCIWAAFGRDTHTAVFVTVRERQRKCRLAGLPCFPIPLTAGARDRNWNSSALDGCQSGSPSSPGCDYLFPVKVKINSLLKSFSQFPSFWNDSMKWPQMTDSVWGSRLIPAALLLHGVNSDQVTHSEGT